MFHAIERFNESLQKASKELVVNSALLGRGLACAMLATAAGTALSKDVCARLLQVKTRLSV